MSDREVSEAAELDRAVARAFGRAPGPDDPVVSLFREAGLCQESAETAARGLSEGWYFSFEDAALSAANAWGYDNESHRRRVANRGATPERIAEVARKVPGAGQSVSEGAAGDRESALIAEISALAKSRFGYTQERARVYAEGEVSHIRGVGGGGQAVLESLERHRDALVQTSTMAERLARGKR